MTEHEIDEELRGELASGAAEGAELLGLSITADAEAIVCAIDAFLVAWQQGVRPQVASHQDLSFTLGCLWGQQLVRALNWQWAAVFFDTAFFKSASSNAASVSDAETRDAETSDAETLDKAADADAVGVFSPDRSLAIYPFHFVFGCIEDGCPVTIALAFDILLDGKRVPALPENGYENVMDNVHHSQPGG